jgi:exopolyphosphatase/pppGpp-phosphohydrolase
MLLLIAEVSSSRKGEDTRTIGKVFDDRINFVRLGQGVHQNRAFAPEAMERALKCFHEY